MVKNHTYTLILILIVIFQNFESSLALFEVVIPTLKGYWSFFVINNNIQINANILASIKYQFKLTSRNGHWKIKLEKTQTVKKSEEFWLRKLSLNWKFGFSTRYFSLRACFATVITESRYRNLFSINSQRVNIDGRRGSTASRIKITWQRNKIISVQTFYYYFYFRYGTQKRTKITNKPHLRINLYAPTRKKNQNRLYSNSNKFILTVEKKLTTKETTLPRQPSR